MPEPTIIQTMSRFRAEVQQGETEALRIMARRWIDVERTLEMQIELVARQIADLKAAGKAVTPELLMLLDHSQSMLLQTRQQIVRYAAFTDDLITERQREMARLGIEHASQAIQTVSARAVFSRLNVAAVESVIGLAGNGSPLRTLLEATYADGANGILDILIRGVAIGKSPRTMAKQAVREGLSKSLNHMMVTMRSETLRVYRHTAIETYKESRICYGYFRVASLSKRTCLGCLAQNGVFFPLDVPFEEHASGRCAPRPGVIGADEIKVKSGAEWFAEQPAATQREMLGPGRYDLYKNGTPFEAFSARRENATWGASYVPANLTEVRSG